MEPRLRALIFDCDGVIIDSERVMAECTLEVLAEWGATDVDLDTVAHIFGSVDFGPQWDELIRGWCGRSAAELDARLADMVAPRKDALPLLPGVRELIDAADADGVKVGLGTGGSRSFLEPRLERLGILHRFHAVVTRADVEQGKPAPDIYLEVARRLDVDPATCLVLEDSVPGCEAAIAAGMRVIACPSIVTAGCEFPDGAVRVASLLEVTL